MPKPFQFELEPVLEHRRRLERERQGSLARAQAERLAIEDRARRIQAMIASGKQAAREALAPGAAPGGVAIAVVRFAAHGSLHLTVQLQRLALEAAGVQQRINAARGELLRATVARKAVETLRERRYKLWFEAERRRESAELDEINTARASQPAGDQP